MTELLLVDVEADRIEARLVLKGARVEVTGDSADVARAILLGRMRGLNLSEVEAFDRLRQFGWSNGVLALRQQ
jgi:hypothetical protein